MLPSTQATIHLSTANVLANRSVALREKRATETKETAERRVAKRQITGGANLPFTAIDATTAHEMWHLVEATFEAKRYKESVEFRRQLGFHLGVATLEQAVKGHGRYAPDSWKAASKLLAEEVSLYATTNAKEATAELFKAWWCRTGDLAPVVARFGELLDEFFVTPTAYRRMD